MSKNCIYQGEEYSQGSVICQDGNEFVCDNGEWNRTGAQCDENTKTLVNENAIGTTEQSENSNRKTGDCVTFVPGNYPGTTVPLRNKCDKSKQTTILWSDKTESNYCIAAHSTLWINTNGKKGNIIDETDC